MSEQTRGSKIGPRIAMLVSNAIVATQGRLLHTKHRLGMMLFREMSDEISREVDMTMGKMLADWLEKHPDDGKAHDLLRFLVQDHGQLKAILGNQVAGAGLLWPISAILNNELSQLVYDELAFHPVMLPDANTASTLYGQGLLDEADANYVVRASGIRTAYANLILESAKQYPGMSEAIELYRRGKLSRQDFITWARRNGVTQDVAETYLVLAEQPISPADAALAVLRGNMSMSDAESIARQWGVSQSGFQTLIDNTGEPLGLEQLLEAYRRGFINKARLEDGIRQSRVRDEWIGTAEQLRFSPMSVADAVNAVVQGHLSEADARTIAEQNGLQPGQVDTLFATAGEPLSRTEMSELYNRGLITEAQFLQASSESRLKPKYEKLAFALRTKLIEPRELSSAVRYGAISHADAVKRVMQSGYNESDAQIIVSSGTNEKLQQYRSDVMAAIATMYEDNAISEQQAQAMAQGLGFESQEVDFILQAAQFKAVSRMLNSAISAVRSKYIAHRVNKTTASGLIDALGVPSSQRDMLLTTWDVERDANVKILTEAQVVKAVSLQLITEDDGTSRLIAMGYNATDAGLLLNGA